MRSLVVSESPQDPVATTFRRSLQPLIGNSEAASASFENAEHVYFQTEAQLVVVILPRCPEKGLDAILRLRATIQGHLLVVGNASEPKLILRALQNGADHFLDEAELETELDAALARLFNKTATSTPSGALLALLSVSGGCGASTLAVNMSAAIAKERKSCCLVDLNPGCGDLCAFLDVKPQFTLADLCVNQARLDRTNFEKMLTRHASGIHLLASPPMFEDARAIDPRGVRQALNMARRIYPYVIVDLEDCFHDEQIVALHQATGILLVCRLDFSALRNARRILDHLSKLDIQRRRVRLVINQYGQSNDLPVHEAEDALGEKFDFIVPYDSNSIRAANNIGIPVVERDPHTKVAQRLTQLAKLYCVKHEASSAALPKVVSR